MAGLIFNFTQILFRLLCTLIVTGVFISALADIQTLAFESKRKGLISMLQINEQLVGKTK